MKFTLFCTVLYAGIQLGLGQVYPEIIYDSLKIEKLNTEYSLFYHNGIKPGLNFSLEYPVVRISVESYRFPVLSKVGIMKLTKKQIIKHKIIRSSFNVYLHPENHTGANLSFYIVKRRINQKNHYTDLAAGVGILHEFLPATYKYTETGFEKVFLPGRTYFTNSYSICFGKQINSLTEKPFIVFVRPTVFFIMPYNHMFNVAYSVEWGIRINNLKNFLDG